MMKQTIVKLASRHRDGSPMFLGPHRLTWVRAGGVWLLVGMEPLR